jgi:hypothetical protein
MGVQPTRPQQVYSGQPLPPAHQYPPRPPQYYPGQPPVPGPPPAPHRPPRKGWTLRQKLLAAAGVVIVVAAAAIGLSQHRAASAASADQGQAAPVCYAAVSDAFGDTVTVAALGTSDCTTVAADVQGSMPPGFTATPNTAKGPGTAVCAGTVDGDPVSVIDPEGNPSNAVCSDLGFSALP